ncbi:hypothetical protein Mapa_010900 [Marchantia paleacea]|nr:hypothetical protein Mapa_010900 [Marchantia paleacea]
MIERNTAQRWQSDKKWSSEYQLCHIKSHKMVGEANRADYMSNRPLCRYRTSFESHLQQCPREKNIMEKAITAETLATYGNSFLQI